MPDLHSLPREPARKLIVLTCMDARVDPLSGFGLSVGDAHVLRNAGASMTEDVLRGIEISREVMGTEEAWVVAHSDCAARGGDDATACEAARQCAAQLAETGLRARAFFYDFSSGLREI